MTRLSGNLLQTNNEQGEGFANAVELFMLHGYRSNAQFGMVRAGVDAWES